MTTPTIKELIEKATPGPWQWHEHSDGNAFALVGLNGRADVLLATDIDEDRIGIAARDADLDYIARLNPATVRKVVDALEGIPPCNVSMDASFVFQCTGSEWTAWMERRNEALAALNGEQAT